MADWRVGLSWVPLIVFFSLFALFVLIGIFGGHKRALYWFGGLLWFYCVGWILNAFLGDIIAKWIASFSFIANAFSDSGLTQDQIAIMIAPFSGIVMVAISLIIGLIVLFICYYAFAKRLMLLKKVKSKSRAGITIKRPMVAHSKRYKVLSHIAGGFCGLILTMPIVNSLTEITYAATTSYNDIKKDPTNNFVYNYVNWTDYALSYNYVHDITRTTDGIFSLIDFAKAEDVNKNKLLPTFFQNLASALIVVLPTTEKSEVSAVQLDALKDFVSEYGVYVESNANTLKDGFASVTEDKACRDAFVKLATSIFDSSNDQIKKYRLTHSNFHDQLDFLKALTNGSRINLKESTDSGEGYNWLVDYDLTMSSYTKLQLDDNSYNAMTQVFANVIFDKSTWTDLNEFDESVKAIVNLFFTNDAQEEIQINDFDSAEHNTPLALISKWDSVLLNMKDREGKDFVYDAEEVKSMKEADGTASHPYIIPEKLFWTYDSTKQQVLALEDSTRYIKDYFNWTFVPEVSPANANYKLTWTEELVGDLSGTGLQISSTGAQEGTVTFAIDTAVKSTLTIDQLRQGKIFTYKISAKDSVSGKEFTKNIYFNFSKIGTNW